MYKLLSLYDKIPVENSAMFHKNNMEQSITLHHNQIQPMKFEPSSIMIYGNPSFFFSEFQLWHEHRYRHLFFDNNQSK